MLTQYSIIHFNIYIFLFILILKNGLSNNKITTIKNNIK